MQIEKVLNDEKVERIISRLVGEVSLQPYELQNNLGLSIKGSELVGDFYISEEQRQNIISENPKYADVLRPFMGGQRFVSEKGNIPDRYVIFLGDRSLKTAELEYPIVVNILRERFFTNENPNENTPPRKNWWQFHRSKQVLYEKSKNLTSILLRPYTSNMSWFEFAPTDWVVSNSLVAVISDDFKIWALLNSSIHEEHAVAYASRMKTDIRYTPSTCFGYFPFPRDLSGLEDIGERYHETRRQIMLARQEGLTKTYNRFHNPEEHAADIVELRRLHVEMDTAVAAAYEWQELELGHDFHETAQGIRYTISESARREVLSRLLKLNHERWEEEQRQGMDETGKKKAGKTGRKREASSQPRNRKLAESPAQYGLLMDIAPAPEPETVSEKPTPTHEIGNWDQCVCLGCGKHLVGFSVAEHTKSVHEGMDPGYRKMVKG
jgi:hypothetical protein